MEGQRTKVELEEGEAHNLILGNEISPRKGMYIGNEYGIAGLHGLDTFHYFVISLNPRDPSRFVTIGIGGSKLTQPNDKTLSSADFFQGPPHTSFHRTAMSLLMKRAGLI